MNPTAKGSNPAIGDYFFTVKRKEENKNLSEERIAHFKNNKIRFVTVVVKFYLGICKVPSFTAANLTNSSVIIDLT